ncbi:hypothetical protein ['Camptotheca acuminata' phytoplasma]|uniref:hypothetical protein n=1 Tax='Camptotheca acuminata' phytoplasma TaxID=3239192 RepID=UPI00351A9ABE
MFFDFIREFLKKYLHIPTDSIGIFNRWPFDGFFSYFKPSNYIGIILDLFSLLKSILSTIFLDITLYETFFKFFFIYIALRLNFKIGKLVYLFFQRFRLYILKSLRSE